MSFKSFLQRPLPRDFQPFGSRGELIGAIFPGQEITSFDALETALTAPGAIAERAAAGKADEIVVLLQSLMVKEPQNANTLPSLALFKTLAQQSLPDQMAADFEDISDISNMRSVLNAANNAGAIEALAQHYGVEIILPRQRNAAGNADMGRGPKVGVAEFRPGQGPGVAHGASFFSTVIEP